jgi:uncharacterized membrane protein
VPTNSKRHDSSNAHKAVAQAAHNTKKDAETSLSSQRRTMVMMMMMMMMMMMKRMTGPFHRRQPKKTQYQRTRKRCRRWMLMMVVVVKQTTVRLSVCLPLSLSLLSPMQDIYALAGPNQGDEKSHIYKK